MNLGLEYIKYTCKAKRRHGIHSPFIYDLTDNCFRLSVSSEFESALTLLDSKLKNTEEQIDIHDFGVGSKKLNNRRKVQDIYKTSSSKGKYGKMLHQLVQHFKPKNVLEFGTSLGIGTICMASGNKESHITTVEGCPNTHALALKNIQNSGFENITSINSTFSDFLKDHNSEKYDMVFIDGHHDGVALMQYLSQLKPFTHNETLFILDDIRWSQSMLSAWNEIKNSQDYCVTVDLFRMGIISPRIGVQEKEHFTIRL
jgi:predicted O-methyltransferase YrrM